MIFRVQFLFNIYGVLLDSESNSNSKAKEFSYIMSQIPVELDMF